MYLKALSDLQLLFYSRKGLETCQYKGNQSPEDGSRAKSLNVECTNYTPNYGQCPQWFSIITLFLLLTP
jgi:hypothetical protein